MWMLTPESCNGVAQPDGSITISPDNCPNNQTLTGQLVQSQLIDPWVQSWKDGATSQAKSMATFWMNTPSPSLVDSDNHATGAVAWLAGSLAFYTAAAMVAAIIWRGAKLALTGRGLSGIGMLLFRYVVTAGAGLAVVSALLLAGHGFSNWIIETSTNGDFATNMVNLITGEGGGLAAGAGMVLWILALIAATIQLLIMVGRFGLLVIMCALWAMSASVDGWWTKTTGWIIALVAYEPVAAVIYAAAFRLMSVSPNAPDAAISISAGIVVMILSILALPVLIKTCVPATEQVSDGKGLGGAASSAAMIAAMSIR